MIPVRWPTPTSRSELIRAFHPHGYSDWVRKGPEREPFLGLLLERRSHAFSMGDLRRARKEPGSSGRYHMGTVSVSVTVA